MEGKETEIEKAPIDTVDTKEGKESDKSHSLLDHLPPAFTAFLESNGISLEHFSEIENFPRYIRLKPQSCIKDSLEITLDDLKKDLGSEDVTPINYLNGLYSIPASLRIVNSSYYSSGLLYGMDLSSAAVVKALDPQAGERVLDLCCCPGMKLCFIADLIGEKGSAVGVDINETRLTTCRSIVKKYKLNHIIQLVQADGTTYSPETLFDRVLVDAECTHDGSLKHLAKFVTKSKAVVEDLTKDSDTVDDIPKEEEGEKTSSKEGGRSEEKKISNRELKRRKKQLEANNSNTYTQKKVKRNEWSLADFEERVLDPVKLGNIVKLQTALLENGFKSCKDGGIILYSTCSFAKNQNEDVVSAFLEKHPGEVELIPAFEGPSASLVPCKEGFIPLTIRFDAFVSKSGGMFAAKFRKLKSSPTIEV